MRSFRYLTFALALISSLHAQVPWNRALNQPAAWYATPEAAALAASVISYQTPSGGWPKNTDFSKPPSDALRKKLQESRGVATIDNAGTTRPMQFLARVISAAPDAPYAVDARAAFLRGFDYLLEAQYPNGGWPQFYPVPKGYYGHITYNDHAMVNVLTILHAAVAARPPYDFIDTPRVARARDALSRGIDCILRTQVRNAEGRPTVWCAQHDKDTLAPAPARAFEPVSLSGSESARIVDFLLSIPSPSPEIIAAIENAVAWFERVKITGLRYESFTNDDGQPDRRVVPDPSAPPLWARFYELGTDRPIFIGRDAVIHYRYDEIERERRVGYGYYGDYAADLLAKNYPAWKTRLTATSAE